MKENRLIVITGPDGSGKSSVIKKVADALILKHGERSAVSASIWDSLISSGAFEKKAVEKYLAGLSGPARTLFLMHSLLNGLAIAEAKKPQFILMDGYFYKYAAIELAYGVPKDMVQGATAGFKKPEKTFFLDISPEAAWERKQGNTTGYEGGEKEKFLKLQKSSASFLKEIEKSCGPWTHFAESTSIDERASQILEQL